MPGGQGISLNFAQRKFLEFSSGIVMAKLRQRLLVLYQWASRPASGGWLATDWWDRWCSEKSWGLMQAKNAAPWWRVLMDTLLALTRNVKQHFDSCRHQQWIFTIVLCRGGFLRITLILTSRHRCSGDGFFKWFQSAFRPTPAWKSVFRAYVSVETGF